VDPDAGLTTTPPADPNTPPAVPTTRGGGYPAPATDPSSPGDPSIVPVPGYDRLECIGQGGMGTVYRARDVRLGRHVAVKLLQDDLRDNPAAVRRFIEEARITGRLQHPGIPPVHEVGGLADGRPFLAMKLIRGQTLAKLLAAGRTERGALVGMFEQICQAVAYAHAHKVIHRDLKPENVMVGAFGEVQVMDWGLAKVRSAAREASPVATLGDPRAEGGDGSETRAGSVMGTPAYMAPEQAIGAIDQVDERSDVFGLGAILCMILTGKPPFVGANSEATRQLAARGKLDQAFARLDRCKAEPDLVALCKRCLSAEKADRPKDADEVARAVAGLRTAAAERARKAELDRVRAEGDLQAAELKAAELRKRRRILAALATAIGLLLVGGAAVGWWADRQAGQRRADNLRQQLEEEQRTAAERDQRSRRVEAVGTLIGQCEAALRADDADKAALALRAADGQAAEGGAEGHAGRVDRCRADVALLRDLDRVDDQRWTLRKVDGKHSYPAPAEWAPGLAAAFAKWGIVPGMTPAADVAHRLADSPVRDRVLMALDVWMSATGPAGLADLLKEIDPDEFRDTLRGALASRNGALLAELAAQPAASQQPARFAAVLGTLDPVPQEVRQTVLDVARRQRPGDFGLLMARAEASFVGGIGGGVPGMGPSFGLQEWYRAAVAVRPKSAAARHDLGVALSDSANPDGAVPELQEAVRLDPEYFEAHLHLGDALRAVGKPADAVAAYRDALRINPKDPPAHNNLGLALQDKGDAAGAATEFRAAFGLDPNYAEAHFNLGKVRNSQGDPAGAVAEFREAVRLTPTYAEAHYQLGLTLLGQDDLAGAVAAYKEVVRLDPNNSDAHQNLGLALYDLGDPAGAAAAFREEVQLNPDDPQAHRRLGIALQSQGDFAGATAELKEAVRLGLKAADVDPLLRRVARYQQLTPRLADVAAGRAKPASSAEACELGELAARPFHRRYLLSVRLYEQALTADPTLAAAHRYNAACAAARAAAGDDPSARTVDATEWARLTGLAHDWLRTDLADLKGRTENPAAVRRTLTHWRRDPDLVAIRDPNRLRTMTAADRKRWEQFWADVDAVLKTRP
jgi:eukaryotic-like serine/threonine-protein kinase